MESMADPGCPGVGLFLGAVLGCTLLGDGWGVKGGEELRGGGHPVHSQPLLIFVQKNIVGSLRNLCISANWPMYSCQVNLLLGSVQATLPK